MLAAGLLATMLAWADDATDRTAIESRVRALNQARTEQAVARLFVAGAENDLDRISEWDPRPWSEQWPERTAPMIVVQTIRFVTPDVALVEAARTSYGSVFAVTRVPLFLVMKRDGGEWRIAALRVLQQGAPLMRRL